jgi:hypothetical protein
LCDLVHVADFLVHVAHLSRQWTREQGLDRPQTCAARSQAIGEWLGTIGGLRCFLSAMPVLKYFLLIGPVLSLLLFAWSAYLGPMQGPVAVTQPGGYVVFHPTPPPPLAELQPTPEPATTVTPRAEVTSIAAPSAPAPAKAAQAQRRKPKTRVVRHSQPPTDAFAFAPRSLFDWR